jgi:hypothetical protein
MARKAAKSSRSKATRRKALLLSGLLLLFVIGGVYSAYLFYTTIKDFVAHALLGMPSAQTNIEQGRAAESPGPRCFAPQLCPRAHFAVYLIRPC